MLCPVHPLVLTISAVHKTIRRVISASVGRDLVGVERRCWEGLVVTGPSGHGLWNGKGRT